MGLFKRISDIISANLNALLDAAEDPEKTSAQIVREISEAVRLVKRDVARAIAAESLLEGDVEQCRRLAVQWEEKALWAIERDNDALARRAVEKKVENARRAEELTADLPRARKTSADLRTSLAALERKLDEAVRKRDELTNRAHAARARRHASGAIERAGERLDEMDRMERLDRRVRLEEAESEAMASVAAPEPDIEATFAELQTSEAVERELAELKTRARRPEGPD